MDMIPAFCRTHPVGERFGGDTQYETPGTRIDTWIKPELELPILRA
jgi:hypothetical protein